MSCLASSPDTSVLVLWASPAHGALSALSQCNVWYKTAIIASGMSSKAGCGKTKFLSLPPALYHTSPGGKGLCG